jgi:hypothetical protein
MRARALQRLVVFKFIQLKGELELHSRALHIFQNIDAPRMHAWQQHLEDFNEFNNK